uniref:Uncharacterized protein n=1 Tax=Oryza sativa subsp. japonica TaxID=39947 RepID=Q6ERV3_ORYSJ|nr:hypothetical protein [Oryza sativa Japonica Group]BAD28617.1 hypothetical protein [Oryza sativa Japonica Group]
MAAAGRSLAGRRPPRPPPPATGWEVRRGRRGEGRRKGRRREIYEEEGEGICEDVVVIVEERISDRDYILRIKF